MTYRIKDLRPILAALQAVSDVETTAAYRIARNIKLIEPHIKRADADEREQLEKLCDKNEDGTNVLYDTPSGEQQIRVTDQEKVLQLIRVLREIGDEEVDLRLLPLYGDEFEGTAFAPSALLPLLDIIEER